MKIQSIRSHTFLLSFIFLATFFGLMSVAVLFALKNAWGILIAVTLAALILYCTRIYLTESSTITLDEDKLSVQGQSFYWTDLDELKITGKTKFFSLFGLQEEGTMMRFKNRTEPLIIVDIVYQNAAELKRFIYYKIWLKENHTAKIVNPKVDDLPNELFIDYKGHPIFSFRGIVLWSLIVFTIYVFYFSNSPLPNWQRLIYSSIMCSLWFILNAYCMFYFSLSDNIFRIRNHCLLWKQADFRFEDIFEIVFETQPKQPNKLRLITKDFRSKVFAAGSLSDSMWLELKRELEKHNVKVRNECI